MATMAVEGENMKWTRNPGFWEVLSLLPSGAVDTDTDQDIETKSTSYNYWYSDVSNPGELEFASWDVDDDHEDSLYSWWDGTRTRFRRRMTGDISSRPWWTQAQVGW